jgi:RHS repeat-associated protein
MVRIAKPILLPRQLHALTLNPAAMKNHNLSPIIKLIILITGCLAMGNVRAQTDTTLSGANTSGTVTATRSITLSNGFSSAVPFHAFITSPINNCIPFTTAPQANYNYIITYTPRIAGVTDPNSLPAYVCQLMQSIQYFDGLGRLVQTVQTSASAAADKDVVTPVAYDGFGRQITKYLPYAATGSPGSLRTGAYTDQSAYYSPGTTVPGVVRTATPYSQQFTEFSPLNRPLENGSPGDDWQPGNGHTVRSVYTLNDNITFNSANNLGSRQVVYYTATVNSDGSRTLGISSTYMNADLQVTITKDENWVPANGSIGTTETYTDKEGRVVLKRTYNNASGIQMLSTYYVYDDFGLLSFALPPGTNPDAGTTISQTTLDNLAYQYQYDERGRQIQKKLPGKGWEYTVYNTLDQPVATQDANQRISNQWTFTKYDGQGRSVITGLWNNSNTAITRADLQTAVNTTYNTTLWETPVNSGNGYTSSTFPTANVTATLGIKYYDGYNNIPGLPGAYSAPSGASIRTAGLLTATKTAVLNNPTDMLWTANYYDELGRNLQTYRQHYLGGVVSNSNYDAISSTYDFTNAVTAITRQHYTTTGLALTIGNTYVYDQLGRRRQVFEQLNSGTNILLSQQDYNDIGQLLTKHLHSTDGGSTFLQAIGYAYNERGWLKTSSAPLFAIQLNYNDGTTPQYNGNIANQYWGTPGSLGNSYTYSYDKLNRLTAGVNNNGYTEQNIGYDVMGNITALTRQSNTYTYNYSGNQLSSVTGLTNTYAYDANGNATTDGRTGKTIAYNLLNLPQTESQGGNAITYTYDAGGGKLRKTNGTTTTDYIDGIQYDNGTISFLQTEEGRAVNSSGSYSYQYNLADHLNNTRLTFNSSGTTIQKDDYYPFGLDINYSSATPKNEYLYNNKELQVETNQYDYGARFYDPVIARWTVPDPLADSNRRWSPYSYAANNPIRNIDPDGMDLVIGPFGTTADVSPMDHWEASGDVSINGQNFSMDVLSVMTPAILTNLNQPNQSQKPANQGGDPPLTRAQQLAKYGYVVGGFNFAGTLSLGFGGTIEFGVINTNKGWAQNYMTIYYTNTAAAGISDNAFFLINKGNNRTAISDWAGPVLGGSLNYEFYSVIYGNSSTYHQVGGGLGVGLSFSRSGSYSAGYTYLLGSPYYKTPYDQPGTHVIK